MERNSVYRNMSTICWSTLGRVPPFVSILLLIVTILKTNVISGAKVVEDWLIPYLHHHGPTHHHRVVRDCQPAHYNNVTHEVYKSHFSNDKELPLYEHYMFAQDVGEYSWNQHNVQGHLIKVSNPFKTFTVVEPGGPGGCENNTKSRVVDTALTRQCVVASNAAFFNTTDGSCLGNLVTDGQEILNNHGIQNAHFGIKKDGSLFTGYLPETSNLAKEFRVLVGGVIWLVRDGVNYVDEALKAECSDMQETGSLDSFADVISARTALGHDADGRVIMAQVNGKTWSRGINLREFADLLIQVGVVNAINTDGGGSATLVINNTVVNQPSDYMKSEEENIYYTQAREVSTIACVHALRCVDDCNHHGDCIHGQCLCHGRWVGVACSNIQCGKLNCSTTGLCTERGCVCKSEWQGPDCTSRCPAGFYGASCAHKCKCANGAECNHVDGSCQCTPGYTGLLCDQVCPYGMYGENCRQICYCEDSCFCDHVTGFCNVTQNASPFWLASQCLAEQYIADKKLVPDQYQEYRSWLILTVIFACVAAVSIIINFACLCRTMLPSQRNAFQYQKSSHQPRRKQRLGGRKSRKMYTASSLIQRSVLISSYSSDDEEGWGARSNYDGTKGNQKASYYAQGFTGKDELDNSHGKSIEKQKMLEFDS